MSSDCQESNMIAATETERTPAISEIQQISVTNAPPPEEKPKQPKIIPDRPAGWRSIKARYAIWRSGQDQLSKVHAEVAEPIIRILNFYITNKFHMPAAGFVNKECRIWENAWMVWENEDPQRSNRGQPQVSTQLKNKKEHQPNKCASLPMEIWERIISQLLQLKNIPYVRAFLLDLRLVNRCFNSILTSRMFCCVNGDEDPYRFALWLIELMVDKKLNLQLRKVYQVVAKSNPLTLALWNYGLMNGAFYCVQHATLCVSLQKLCDPAWNWQGQRVNIEVLQLYRPAIEPPQFNRCKADCTTCNSLSDKEFQLMPKQYRVELPALTLLKALHISDSDYVPLSEAFRLCEQSHDLRYLRVGCKIEDPGISELLPAISVNHTQLEFLHLRRYECHERHQSTPACLLSAAMRPMRNLKGIFFLNQCIDAQFLHLLPKMAPNIESIQFRKCRFLGRVPQQASTSSLEEDISKYEPTVLIELEDCLFPPEAMANMLKEFGNQITSLSLKSRYPDRESRHGYPMHSLLCKHQHVVLPYLKNLETFIGILDGSLADFYKEMFPFIAGLEKLVIVIPHDHDDLLDFALRYCPNLTCLSINDDFIRQSEIVVDLVQRLPRLKKLGSNNFLREQSPEWNALLEKLAEEHHRYLTWFPLYHEQGQSFNRLERCIFLRYYHPMTRDFDDDEEW